MQVLVVCHDEYKVWLGGNTRGIGPVLCFVLRSRIGSDCKHHCDQSELANHDVVLLTKWRMTGAERSLLQDRGEWIELSSDLPSHCSVMYENNFCPNTFNDGFKVLVD